MPRRKGSSLHKEIASIIAPRRILKLARQLKVVRRQRKVDVVSLVMALVLGFGTSRRRTIAGLRRAYECGTGKTLAPSAFYGRFTSGLAVLLRTLAEQAMASIEGSAPALRNSLGRFKQVLVADGSLLRLHDALARYYPSIWTNYMKASAKLHVVINVAGRSAQSVHLARGSRQDVRLLKIGQWVRGKLLIFDLGYSKGLLLRNIDRLGGFFLIRKKAVGDPVVTAGPAGLAGRRLSEIERTFQGEAVDLYIDQHWRPEGGKNTTPGRVFPARVIASWHAAEQRYRFYVTNAPPQMLAAAHVAAVYAARWEVELFFRELKLVYRIEDIPTRKRCVAECLIYAALLTSLLSRRLRQALFSLSRPPAIERWAIVFATFALEILHLSLGSYPPPFERRLVKTLKHEALDPNINRLPLLSRAQAGLLASA
jgi:putative transposase